MAKQRKSRTKTFEQKLNDGDIIDIVDMAAQTGYSQQHLRRLCHGKKIAHIERDSKKLAPVIRGGKQFFFYKESLKDVLKYVSAKA